MSCNGMIVSRSYSNYGPLGWNIGIRTYHATKIEGYFGSEGNATEGDTNCQYVQTVTLRNFINNFASQSESFQNTHYYSKYLVLGAVVSVAGAIEALVKIVLGVIGTIFCALFDRNVISEPLGLAQYSTVLLGYHAINICTLGLLGFSISDQRNPTTILARGCPYGDQDMKSIGNNTGIDAQGIEEAKRNRMVNAMNDKANFYYIPKACAP